MKRRRGDSIVIEASRRFRRYLREANGGRLPRTVAGWLRLCEKFDIQAGPLSRQHPGFSARLIFEQESGEWFICYDRFASARAIMKFLCHELAEYLAINDFPSLFDDLPDVESGYGNTLVYFYNGGSNPNDLRHRIAQHVERLCFRY